MTPLTPAEQEFRWEAFWRAPTESSLCMLLDCDFSAPAPARGDIPELSFGALALAACADIRPGARDQQSLRLYGHASLGGYDYPASSAYGSDSEASTRCRMALRAWSKFLAEGPPPTPFEASVPLEIMLSSDVWNRPEFMEPLSEGAPDAGADLMLAALELATLADPTRATASGCVEQFALGASDRNLFLCKARWLTSSAAARHIDFSTLGFDQRPLWDSLCSPLNALGLFFCKAFLLESTSPDSAFAANPLWAKRLLALAAERLCDFSAGSHADQLLTAHAALGRELAKPFAGMPDLLWSACQHLPPFAAHPPSLSIFSSAPGLECSLESRDEIQASFEQLARQGSIPTAPGPDGQSPMEVLRSSTGCEPIAARLESIEIARAAAAAGPTAPSPTRL